MSASRHPLFWIASAGLAASVGLSAASIVLGGMAAALLLVVGGVLFMASAVVLASQISGRPIREPQEAPTPRQVTFSIELGLLTLVIIELGRGLMSGISPIQLSEPHWKTGFLLGAGLTVTLYSARRYRLRHKRTQGAK